MKATCGECGAAFVGPFEEATEALTEHIEREHMDEGESDA